MSKIKLSKFYIKNIVKLALNEDLYPLGDITSNLLKNNINKNVKLVSNQTGIIGGLVRAFFFVKQFNFFLISGLAVLGFTVTLIYDMLTLLAYPVAAGLGFSGILAALIKGLGFTLLHEISNAIVFTVSVPHVIILLNKN